MTKPCALSFLEPWGWGITERTAVSLVASVPGRMALLSNYSKTSGSSAGGGRVRKPGHSNGRRATVNFCPYCMGENLFPTTETDNSWQCREFSVKFHGLLA